ncbi:MAG: rhamnulokinase [Clostridiales bacterium]|nr:rhamnulokinase [Clostridiales bacterium]
MSVYYLAVDIGASSGRHILGHMEDGKIQLEEIYRFENGLVKKDGELCWEYDRLFGEIVNGLKKCKEIGKIPTSMGIDTWGVDFVLLDEKDQVIGNTVGYRDHRTDGMDEEVYKIISLEDLYARTGIQKAIFNTIYQLMAIKKNHPEQLEQARTLLHVPDYFHYLLTGNKTCEYTEATTGQLVSPVTKDWDYDLIEMLGYPKEIFQKLIMPGTVVGTLSEKVKKEVGFDLTVVAPATHDTGSSVLAVPANDDDFIYISSGTWSLMGIERLTPDCSKRSCELNLTNEGGYAGRFRYLKNIMGLWMIQSVRHEYHDAYSFGQICEMAEEAKDFPSRVDVNDDCFLSPDNMTEAVKDYCRKSGQAVPETLGELATVIYASLAECYAKTVKELEEMGGREYHRIHIMGGGSNAEYLNELTAKATGKEVHAGPTESTAIGNILAQMLKQGEFNSIEEARTCVHESFGIKVYNEKTLA